jgi:hypothetical protein
MAENEGQRNRGLNRAAPSPRSSSARPCAWPSSEAMSRRSPGPGHQRKRPQPLEAPTPARTIGFATPFPGNGQCPRRGDGQDYSANLLALKRENEILKNGCGYLHESARPLRYQVCQQHTGRFRGRVCRRPAVSRKRLLCLERTKPSEARSRRDAAEPDPPRSSSAAKARMAARAFCAT